jgi:hypothetical protein
VVVWRVVVVGVAGGGGGSTSKRRLGGLFRLFLALFRHCFRCLFGGRQPSKKDSLKVSSKVCFFAVFISLKQLVLSKNARKWQRIIDEDDDCSSSIVPAPHHGFPPQSIYGFAIVFVSM